MGMRGYSLIEMMMAIVILVILTAVALVKLTSSLPHQRVDLAVNVVAGDLQYAQQLAVKQRKPVTIAVDTAAKSYSIKDRASSTVYRTQQLGSTSEFQLTQLTTTGTVVIFPNGAASAASTTYTVGINGYTRTVYITSAGMIRVP